MLCPGPSGSHLGSWLSKWGHEPRSRKLAPQPWDTGVGSHHRPFWTSSLPTPTTRPSVYLAAGRAERLVTLRLTVHQGFAAAVHRSFTAKVHHRCAAMLHHRLTAERRHNTTARAFRGPAGSLPKARGAGRGQPEHAPSAQLDRSEQALRCSPGSQEVAVCLLRPLHSGSGSPKLVIFKFACPLHAAVAGA